MLLVSPSVVNFLRSSSFNGQQKTNHEGITMTGGNSGGMSEIFECLQCSK